MSTTRQVTQQINRLWERMQAAIDAAYDHGKTDEAAALRDYASNVSMNGAIEKLLADETANERQHRRGWPHANDSVIGPMVAARLLLVTKFAEGSELKAMPPATDWLIYRRTAVEAELLGWLSRHAVLDDFRAECKTLDYAKLMNGGM